MQIIYQKAAKETQADSRITPSLERNFSSQKSLYHTATWLIDWAALDAKHIRALRSAFLISLLTHHAPLALSSIPHKYSAHAFGQSNGRGRSFWPTGITMKGDAAPRNNHFNN